MIEGNTSHNERGDVYLASMRTQSNHDSWLIRFGAYYHMTPQKIGSTIKKSLEGEISSWEMIHQPIFLDKIKSDIF